MKYPKAGTQEHQTRSYIGNTHAWVARRKQKPLSCEQCEREGLLLELSNKDHSYRRVVADYRYLCRRCHRLYDIEHNSLVYLRGTTEQRRTWSRKGGMAVLRSPKRHVLTSEDRRNLKILTEEQDLKLYREYIAGATQLSLVGKYGLSRSTIQRGIYRVLGTYKTPSQRKHVNNKSNNTPSGDSAT